MRVAAALFTAFLFVAPNANAGPLDDAHAAFQRHDYQTAVRILQPLADQGNGEAQELLGDIYHIYFRGSDVKKDDSTAV